MKVTDVIFLGAGASAGAGFPVNAQLAKYIIDEMTLMSAPGEFAAIRKKLGKTYIPSVDEFCQMTADQSEVQLLKLVTAVALIQYSNKQQNWRSVQNIYRDFLPTLFPQAGIFPEGRFFIVNFNYDGLLGKMLLDSVQARLAQTQQALPPKLDIKLCAMNGFYIHSANTNRVERAAIDIHGLQPDLFRQILPHGTYSVWRLSDGTLVSHLNQIYPESGTASANDIWKFGWENRAFPQIDFPWEADCQATEFHRGQMRIAARAIVAADRIHFIGLQGHPLMRDSLQRMFSELDPNYLKKKQWHVATKESDPERVLSNICSCFLSSSRAADHSWRAAVFNSDNLHYYRDFAEWIYKAPHHPRHG